MPANYLIADLHFGQETINHFKKADGTNLRPFSSAEEMDATLIANWNKTVRPNDKVYVLGDVVMKTKHIHTIMPQLNGDLVLIKGNHDIGKLKDYTPYFRDIRAYHIMNGCILSHIPIHPSSLGRFGCNIHGHTHANEVTLESGEVDVRYFNVSVERINFTPILLEKVFDAIVARGGKVGFQQYGQVAM